MVLVAASMIVPVFISHPDNPCLKRFIYALLDTQSNTTVIMDQTCEALCIDGPQLYRLCSQKMQHRQQERGL